MTFLISDDSPFPPLTIRSLPHTLGLIRQLKHRDHAFYPWFSVLGSQPSYLLHTLHILIFSLVLAPSCAHSCSLAPVMILAPNVPIPSISRISLIHFHSDARCHHILISSPEPPQSLAFTACPGVGILSSLAFVFSTSASISFPVHDGN